MHPGASLAAAISLPLLVAFAGSLVTRDALKPGGWYAKLRKPSWTPPNRVFPVVWSALYVAMGVASHLVWQSGGGGVPLLVYAGYLITNSLWSPLFFGLKAVKLALADILLNLVAAAACVVTFYPVNHQASLLMVPLFFWTSFATALNASIVHLNHERGTRKKR